MSTIRSILILSSLFLSVQCFGESQFENTLTYDEAAGSPRANLGAVAWIAGHWQAEAMGGVAEEIWTPPLGGSMMAAFKLVVDGQVRFYELETIIEQDETLILKLKHFSSALQGWEAQDETVDFRLVKVTADKVYFDGMTFEKAGEAAMNVYVVIGDEGAKQETRFSYQKVKGPD